MRTLLIVSIVVNLLTCSIIAQPGFNNLHPGYGQIYAQSFPYSFGYNYVTAGFGNRYHPLQSLQPQFSIAKVKKEQNSLGYEYSIHESGPNHHKHVHQTASTGRGLDTIVTLAAPVAPIIPQEVIYYPQYHQQQPAVQIHQHKHGVSGYIPPSPPHNKGFYEGQGPIRGGFGGEVPLSSYLQEYPVPFVGHNNGGQYFYGQQQDKKVFDSPIYNVGYQSQEFPYAYGDRGQGQSYHGRGPYY